MDSNQEIESLDQSISCWLPEAKNGCSEAQSALLEQLRSYCLLMAKSNLDPATRARVNPSDIVQETFAKVATSFGDFRGASAVEFRGWVKTILENQIKEQQRKQRQQKRDVRREAKLDFNDESRNLGMEPIAGSLTPQSQALAKEELAQLRNHLSNLSDEHRQVIQLRSLERKSFKDVAEMMNRSPDAAAKLWYRAILALKKQVDTSQSIDE